MTRKAAISTAAPANRPRISSLPQPSWLPRSSASTNRNSEVLNVVSPAQSILVAFGSRDSRSFVNVAATAANPIGTLSRNTDRQPSPSVRAPPTSGPIATAIPIVAP
jgi:hypothetical protein